MIGNQEDTLSIKDIYAAKADGPFFLGISSLFINLLALALPIILMQVYDRIIAQHGVNTLLWLIIGGVIAIIIESVLRLTRFYLGSWIVAQYEYSLGNKIFKALFRNSNVIQEKFNVGEILDILRFPSKVRTLYTGQIFQVLLDLPFSLIFIAIVSYLNVKLGVFLIVLNSAFFFIDYQILNYLLKTKEATNELQTSRFTFLIEIISKIQLLKSLGIGENVLRKNEHIQEKSTQGELKETSLTSLPQALTVLFSQLNLFGIIIIGAMDVMSGKMTIGMLTACTILGGRSFKPLVGVFSFLNQKKDLQLAYQKVAEVLRLSKELHEDTLPPLPDKIDGGIEFQNVHLSYENITVFDGVDLIIAPKEIVGVKGKNKTGTTSLLNLIMGNQKATAGNVLIDNFNVQKFKREDGYSAVSYVSKESSIYKGTIIENITLFEKGNDNVGYDSATIVGLDPIVSELPYGYNTEIDSFNNANISGDLLVRIILARVLVHRPKILIVDKIDVLMDRETEEMFYWLIQKLKGIMTIILVTQNYKFFDKVDKIIEIRSGKIIPVLRD